MLTSTFRRVVAAAAIAGALALPSPASATSWYITTTGDPTNASPIGTNPISYDLPLTITGVSTDGGTTINPFSPFAISSGDEFIIGVSLSNALTVPGGGLQVFGINFITSPDRSDFVNDPPSTNSTGLMLLNSNLLLTECGNCLGSLIVGVPGSEFTVSELAATALILFAGDGETILEGLTLSYFVIDPASETPLPAALPLFASGLAAMGFVARRRKKKALKQTAG